MLAPAAAAFASPPAWALDVNSFIFDMAASYRARLNSPSPTWSGMATPSALRRSHSSSSIFTSPIASFMGFMRPPMSISSWSKVSPSSPSSPPPPELWCSSEPPSPPPFPSGGNFFFFLFGISSPSSLISDMSSSASLIPPLNRLKAIGNCGSSFLSRLRSTSRPARDKQRPSVAPVGEDASSFVSVASDIAAAMEENGVCSTMRGRVVNARWEITFFHSLPCPSVKELIHGEVHRMVRGSFFAISSS